MNDPIYERTALLIGEEGIRAMQSSRIAVFGIGGVGGYVCEALGRAGVGHLTLVDSDDVSPTNLNRQIIALRSTVGMKKTHVMEQRLKDINPNIDVKVYDMFYTPETADEIDLSGYDYIVDAVDTVAAKIELAVRAHDLHIPIISSMGAGNKLHPEMFEIADISKTSVCPLARVMRHELKKRGILSLKCVYSKEVPVVTDTGLTEGRKRIPASISFVPSTAGLILASEVVRDLIGAD